MQVVPASVSPTDVSGPSTARGSSSISVVAPRVYRDDPLKGRKVRKVFVDQDTGEEGYCNGKIDTVFVDGGVAHYHIVYDDGDEEEAYKDEAIRLPLAANGFGLIIMRVMCIFMAYKNSAFVRCCAPDTRALPCKTAGF